MEPAGAAATSVEIALFEGAVVLSSLCLHDFTVASALGLGRKEAHIAFEPEWLLL